jgi:2-polyprenyl-6-methoxyphenol hydroxylase-like FAD-dependent oxidoreductase
VVEAGTPAVRQVRFRLANDDLTIKIKQAHGVDALYAPRRTVLDPMLVDAAIAAGAEVRYGISVQDVRRDSTGRVTGIDAVDARGEAVAFDAALVIGADGARSTIADRVGAPTDHQGTGRGAVVYGYWSGLEVDGYEWVFRPHVAAGLIPTNDGLTCVFAGASPARIGRGGMAVLEEVIREASAETADRVAAATAPAGVRSFPGLAGYVRRAWGPGWALVGDAGYWKDPISAHGLTDALRDAELLARSVVAWKTGGIPEREALTGYEAERNRLSRDLFATVDSIARLEWSESEIASLLLDLSASMADEVDAIAGLEPIAPRTAAA